jgi:hypothetical protein
MSQVNRFRLISIVSLVALLVGGKVTGTQKQAQHIFLCFLIYFLIVGAMGGSVWAIRRLSKRRAERETLRKLNLYLKKNPINYLQMQGRTKRGNIKSTRW